MTPAPRPSDAQVRAARWAVALLFATNGATFASMVPRYPDLIERLGMSHTVFGLALALGPIGALLSGPFTGTLLKRFPSARLATDAQVLTLLAIALVLCAPAIWVFAAGVALFSLFDVYTDVGQNAHGLRVQKLMGRSVINGFHAFWSLGAMTGGLLGAVLAAWQVPLVWHAVLAVVLLGTLNQVVRRFTLPGPDGDLDEAEDAEQVVGGDVPAGSTSAEGPEVATSGATAAGPAARSGMSANLWVFVALGVVAALGASIEDAGFTWSTLYLREELGLASGLAGAGLVALMAAQTTGRFVGDRFVDRFGERAVVRAGCGVATLALAAMLLWPSPALTVVAFALAGWGVATVVPAAFHAADNVPGLSHGVGLSIVNLMLRAAFIIGPPIVGRVSDLVDLRTALVVMPLATAGVVLLSGVLSGRNVREAH